MNRMKTKCIFKGTDRKLLVVFFLGLWALSCDQSKEDRQIRPVPFHQVKLEDEFWYPRLKTQSEVLVPFAFEKTEPAVENLRRTGRFLKGIQDELPFAHRYISSDLYKVMEGAAYILMLEENKALENKMDSIIRIIGEAQKDDGYLYVAHTTGVKSRYDPFGGAGMGDKPYSFVLHSHELYNMGHMYEAAVAYYQATGKREWLDIAEKNARHINRVFFEGDPDYNGGKPVNQAPGHEEIELGLIKLFRVTGDSLYLNMAKRFLDIRGVTYKTEGKGVMSATYSQQHLPVAQQREPVGHAVRAAYLYSAMAEVQSLLNTDEYTEALNSIWQNIVDTRMHITGGLGAIHGIEGFGAEYELPNAGAYNETCASVGNVFFNFRMFLLTGEAKYLDVAELSLYNNSLAGVSMSGNMFHYVNPLEFDGEKPYNFGNPGRSPWFSTACCPTNIARLIPQVSGMAYTYDEDNIYTGLYMGSSTSIPVKGSQVKIRQVTKYPFEGNVRLEISPDKRERFTLNLRIPTWTGKQFVPGELYDYLHAGEEAVVIRVNGEEIQPEQENGFARISRKWKEGDVVELLLPLSVKYNVSIDQVEDNRNKIAITRGPLVYCAEEIDNGMELMRFSAVDTTSGTDVFERILSDGELRNMVQLTVPAWLQTEEGPVSARLNLVPYFAWNNRGQGAVAVWLPDKASAVRGVFQEDLSGKDVVHQVKVSCASGTTEEVEISSQIPVTDAEPQWQSCLSDENPRVEIPCNPEKELQSFSVYWHDDGKDCLVPEEWELEYRSGNDWEPFKIYATDHYTVFKNQYNMVHPAAPLKCSALRLRIKPKPGSQAGIQSIRIDYTR
jgi:uncharacterized protein